MSAGRRWRRARGGQGGPQTNRSRGGQETWHSVISKSLRNRLSSLVDFSWERHIDSHFANLLNLYQVINLLQQLIETHDGKSGSRKPFPAGGGPYATLLGGAACGER